jgi:hypothetical protein
MVNGANIPFSLSLLNELDDMVDPPISITAKNKLNVQKKL